MQKKIFTLLTVSILGALPLAAATLTTRTAPETDGCLIDTDNDGIVDKATAVKTDGEAREAISGKLWKQNRKAVFEFPLPALEKPVKKATLKLCLNGKFGCHPERAGASGPETDLYYYLAPERTARSNWSTTTARNSPPPCPANRLKMSGKRSPSTSPAPCRRRARQNPRGSASVSKPPRTPPPGAAGAGAPPTSPKQTANSSPPR